MQVRIYRNTGSAYRDVYAWTINALEGPYKGLVISTVDGLILTDVEFIVSEATRKRVVASGKSGRLKKEKHAYGQGTLGRVWPLGTLARSLTGNDLAPGKGATVPISYNPVTMKLFTRLDCMEPVHEVSLVVFAPMGVYGKLGKCSLKRKLNGIPSSHFSVDDWNG
jgi:hypothetical protein